MFALQEQHIKITKQNLGQNKTTRGQRQIPTEKRRKKQQAQDQCALSIFNKVVQWDEKRIINTKIKDEATRKLVNVTKILNPIIFIFNLFKKLY